MSKSRIIYQNWIVDLGGEPKKSQLPKFLSLDELLSTEMEPQNSVDSSSLLKRQELLEEAVIKAMKKLSENEREFIVRYYYMGESYNEISQRSNRAVYKLASMHKRAVKKLQTALADFVQEQFNINKKTVNDCLICRSNQVNEINNLISSRDKTKTWSPIIKLLKSKYKIQIKTPQTLIGHEKYHINN